MEEYSTVYNGEYWRKNQKILKKDVLEDIADRYRRGQRPAYIADYFKIDKRDVNIIISILDKGSDGVLKKQRKEIKDLADAERKAKNENKRKIRKALVEKLQLHVKFNNVQEARSALDLAGKLTDHISFNKIKPEPGEIFEKSFETDVKGEDTLFCDTKFLEQIFRKPLKKTDDCK